MTLIKAADAVGKRKVLHMSGNVLDVDMTLDGIAFCNEDGRAERGRGLQDHGQRPGQARRAPVRDHGSALRGNKTTTEPVIDWNACTRTCRGRGLRRDPEPDRFEPERGRADRTSSRLALPRRGPRDGRTGSRP